MASRERSEKKFVQLLETEHQAISAMAERMVSGAELLLRDRAHDVVLSGVGDTGTVTLVSDVSMSHYLLELARAKYPGSFSEEDALDPTKLAPSEKYFLIDPIDGSGDRKYGQPGTPSGDGYSVLNSFVAGDRSVAGTVYRPAYRQVLIGAEGKIHRYQVDAAGKLQEQPFQRVGRSDGDPVRVNIRPAYPNTNFPEEFWQFVSAQAGIEVVQVETGGAGDSLARLVLGGAGGLDMVYSGRKGDWKTWDTGPFEPMLQTLSGRLTDTRGQPLGGHRRTDQWHATGVMASIGVNEAHTAVVQAIAEWNRTHDPLVFDPRSKK